MTEEKNHRVRFKREGQDYKTAKVNGEENFDYNTGIKVMNKLRNENVASWLFKEGQKSPVQQWVPNNSEEIQL